MPPFGSNDELFVGWDKWPKKSVRMAWTVTDTDTTYATHPWRYCYTFSGANIQPYLDHIIIETSRDFGLADIVGLTGANLVSSGLQTVGSHNTYMMENMYGMEFEPVADCATSITFSFYSNRTPVWGDFYAQSEGHLPDFAFNYNNTGGHVSGFINPDGNTSTLDDIDPTAPPSDECYGSFYHILRPDTVIVPEPGAASLLALGGVLLAMRARKVAR